MTSLSSATSVLSDELLEACSDRAATYDRENRFFTEDFEALREAGYLRTAVPAELGGGGLDLAQICAEQRRLAYRAAPTALACRPCGRGERPRGRRVRPRPGPGRPRFLDRAAEGYTIVETWDTLGMRATQSHDTILDGAFVPDEHVGRVVAEGFAGADLFVLAIFAWAELTFANVYLGLAQRAFDLAVEGVKKKTSVPLGGRSMAYHPYVQHSVAEMVLELDAMVPQVDRIAADWSTGVDHGGLWASKLVSVKHRVTQGAQRVVDLAMEISCGGGMFKRSELERLYRDVRAGQFHPANSSVTHEVVGKSALGVLGEEPRW